MVRWFAAFAFIFILSMVPAPGSDKAFAQHGYPTRPVKFLIPYPGGGTNDVLARIVGDKLQAKWGQPVIIENRSGGGGNIGAALVAQAAPMAIPCWSQQRRRSPLTRASIRSCPTSRKNSCRSQISDQCPIS
jgi:tripartite-type tricarboxylate transporter receptor subunit TctC